MIKPRWFFIVLLVASVAAMIPFALTKRHKSSKTFFCDQCGIRLRVNVNELSISSASREQRTFEETELSRWFAADIGTNCPHSWQFNHLSQQTYVTFGAFPLWRTAGLSGSRATPPLIYFTADDREQVENLLRLNRDECRRHIHARLQKKPGEE